MRVALISFEFPPSVAIGGIGTYAVQAVTMLVERGIDVEVFAAGNDGTTICALTGVLVHRVQASDRQQFSARLVDVFQRRHRLRAFDVFESPEIGADGGYVARACPDVARVIKLHTPSFVVNRLGQGPSFSTSLRFTLGSIRRGRLAFIR